MNRLWLVGLLVLLPACHRAMARPGTTAPGAAPNLLARGADPTRVDSNWARANRLYRRGEWQEAERLLSRLVSDLRPGDPRLPYARFFLGECLLAQENQLQAAREFRRVADDLGNPALAPEALLRVGDAYADLWRKPELDPSYGQTALGTYQELLGRYPNSPAAAKAQPKISELRDRFAFKAYRAAAYYFRFKAYDSAIIYLRDVVATYPKSSWAPASLVLLVEAYQRLGYKEDIAETCGYMRKFHKDAPRVAEVCAGVPAEAS